MLRAELDKGLEGISPKAASDQISKLRVLMNKLMTKQELSGPVYEDLIHLKSMYSRYQNYAHWLLQAKAK